MKQLLLLAACVFFAGCASPCVKVPEGGSPEANPEEQKVEEETPPDVIVEEPQAEEQVRPRHSWGHRILTYIPNRIVDLIDIFRLRLRAGPGLAINIRATERANLYAGIYHTAYVGLPGPRGGPRLRSPVGLEQERGIELMGVDATDDMKHEPGYSASELDIGVHLLIVGAEAGFDPVEFGDFFAGFLFFDPMRDDF